LNEETVLLYQKRDIPNERPSSFASLSKRERNRTKPN